MKLIVNQKKTDVKWELKLFYAKFTFLGAVGKESFKGGCSTTPSVEGKEQKIGCLGLPVYHSYF